MAVKRVKILDGRKKDEESQRGAAADRISKLPDSIIYEILAFLPAIDVVRMSLLSKRWRRMWYSVPTLNLCGISVASRQDIIHFNKFVNNCFKYRQIGMRYIADSSIIRLKLDVSKNGDNPQLDKWLDFFVVKNKLKELDLSTKFGYYSKGYYHLPKAILSAQSLTVLRLHCINVKGPFQVCLPFLKLLSIIHVNGLNDRSFEDVLANCPSLEKLVVMYCKALSTPRVSSPSLQFLEVQLDCNSTIKIEAINLLSLIFRNTKNCRIGLASCMSLESLSLFEAEYLTFDGRSFEDYVFECTLECLTISKWCIWLDTKNIRSQHLKNLIISQKYMKELDSMTIDAPNLVSFTYKAFYMKEFFNISLNSPNLLVCNVILARKCSTFYSSWYVNLISLLSNLNCSKKMCLHVYSEEALIFPNNMRSICRSSLDVEHLKVKTHRPLSKISDLRDALCWLSPSLKSLSIEQEANSLYF